jgi:hypothetical protein
MPAKKHHIKLSPDEREELQAIARKQRASATKVQRARALLAVDCADGRPAMTDREASAGSGLTVRSIERLRARVCEVGPLGALERKKRETPPVPAKVTGEVEARMVQIACSEAPQGRDSWTMKMIADRLVELETVESISGETVRTTLKKTTLSPGGRSAGASPRKGTLHS